MKRCLYTLAFLLCGILVFSQEALQPLSGNLNYFYPDLKTKVGIKPNDISHQKTMATSISLPFKEDFSYADQSYYPDPAKWSDSLVYVNTGYPIAPPSIGVATFDGLNKHGFPYTPWQTNLILPARADTLTSQPINLFTSGSQTLDPFSDVAISFNYQARGNGDTPEPADSLLLDFFRPYAHPDTAWKRVWFVRGNSNPNTNDTVFKRGFVRIKDTAYFHDGFKFRFRNWAATSGNFDHWHLDYIVLDKGRGDSLTDTVSNDISFAGMPTPFLRDYSAMPYQQYIASEMAPNTSVRIRNNSAALVNMGYKYRLFNQAGNPVFTEYNGGFENLNPFKKNTYPVPPIGPGYGYATDPDHAKPPIGFSFPLLTDSVDYKIEHSITLTSGGSSSADFFAANDTVFQYQRFRNYYALDDGSAEAAYYIKAVGGKTAIKINVNVEDTLRAVRIYFDPVGLVNKIQGPSSDYNYGLCIWGTTQSGSPGNLIFSEPITRVPAYYDTAFKLIPEIKFTSVKVLSPGTYFIGFQQNSQFINVGFDKNYDHSTGTYYNDGSGWKQSIIKGSVMIRPVFGKNIPPPVGIAEYSSSAEKSFFVYPNPSNEAFTILSKNVENKSYQLYSSMGQLIKEDVITTNEELIPTTELNAGIYILILKTKGEVVQQQKLIIQH